MLTRTSGREVLDALKRESELAEQEEERRRERKQKMQQRMQQEIEQRELEQREGHAQEVSRFDLAKVALARTGEKAKVLFQMWSPYKVALDAQPNDEESEDDKDEDDERRRCGIDSSERSEGIEGSFHLKQKGGGDTYVWTCKEARIRAECR